MPGQKASHRCKPGSALTGKPEVPELALLCSRFLAQPLLLCRLPFLGAALQFCATLRRRRAAGLFLIAAEGLRIREGEQHSMSMDWAGGHSQVASRGQGDSRQAVAQVSDTRVGTPKEKHT